MPRRPRAAWLTLSGILLLAALLRFLDLGGRSLWLDEVRTVVIARVDLSELWETCVVQQYDYFPLHHLLVKAALWFDDGEFAARVPSVIAGLLGVAVVYQLGRRFFGVAEGLAAATLLAVSHGHLLMSRECRSYSLLLLLVSMLLLLTARALETGRLRDWALVGVLSAVSYYAQPVAVFPVFATLLAVMASVARTPGPSSPSRGTTLLGVLVATAVGLVLLAPLVPPTLAVLDEPLRDTSEELFAPRAGSVVGTGTGDRFAAFLGPGTPALFLVTALTSLAGWLSSLSRCRFLAWSALLWILVPWVVLTVVPLGHFIAARYVSFLLPMLALLSARGCTVLAQRLARSRPRLTGPTTVLAVVALALLNVPAWGRALFPPKSAWREATDFIREQAGRESLIVAGYVTPYPPDRNIAQDYVDCYLDDPRRFPVIWPERRLGAEGDAEQRALLLAREPIVVLSHRPSWSYAGEAPVSVEAFYGLTVLWLRDHGLGPRLRSTLLLTVLAELTPNETVSGNLLDRALKISPRRLARKPLTAGRSQVIRSLAACFEQRCRAIDATGSDRKVARWNVRLRYLEDVLGEGESLPAETAAHLARAREALGQ